MCVSKNWSVRKTYSCAACESSNLGAAPPFLVTRPGGANFVLLFCEPCAARAVTDEGFRYQVDSAVQLGLSRKSLEQRAERWGIPLANSAEEQLASILKALGRRA